MTQELINTPRGPKVKIALGETLERCIPCEQMNSGRITTPDGRPWYFSEVSKRVALYGILKSWLGTPFVLGQSVKAGGTDCIQFAASVYVEAGAMKPIRFPTYTAWGGGEKELEKLLDYLASIPNLLCIWSSKGTIELNPAALMTGDLIVMSSGRAYHHLMILDWWPYAFSAMDSGSCRRPNGSIGDGGVQSTDLKNPAIVKRLFAVYRFAE